MLALCLVQVSLIDYSIFVLPPTAFFRHFIDADLLSVPHDACFHWLRRPPDDLCVYSYLQCTLELMARALIYSNAAAYFP